MNNEDVENIYQKCFYFFLAEQQLSGLTKTNMYASQCFS